MRQRHIVALQLVVEIQQSQTQLLLCFAIISENILHLVLQQQAFREQRICYQLTLYILRLTFKAIYLLCVERRIPHLYGIESLRKQTRDMLLISIEQDSAPVLRLKSRDLLNHISGSFLLQSRIESGSMWVDTHLKKCAEERLRLRMKTKLRVRVDDFPIKSHKLSRCRSECDLTREYWILDHRHPIVPSQTSEGLIL